MRQFQEILPIKTHPYEFVNITSEVQSVVAKTKINKGICALFVRHTSASLIIQENADPAVLRDLSDFMKKLVPEAGTYLHAAEGADDMPSHIRSVLTHTSETIPVSEGRLLLGTWQGIYLWEHRAQAHSRQVVVHLWGE